MEERYIAAIDLGTSKIVVSVAKIQGTNIQVVYYKENPSQGIRYSYVFNPKKVENELRSAISEAQQELRIRIQQVIVGLPRYYVRQETASASAVRQNEDMQIEESEIKALKSSALKSYPLNDSNNDVIYGAVAQSFSTEEEFNELENDIIGMTAQRLEGNFKVLIGNRRHSMNIDNVFKGLGISIARKYFTPGITAKAILKDEQMENGVALIDIGAGVSSVTIFKGKIMRFYASVPFGGNSVTKDIKAECNISDELAENIKKAYGACIPNRLSSFGEKILQINDENDEPIKKIPIKYLSEIITARMREIIEALLYEIERSGYAKEDKLRAGVVITGGGAELVNCANLVKEMSGYSVKIGYPRPFFSCEGCDTAKTTGASTTMGMILAVSSDRGINCAASPSVKMTQKPVINTPEPAKDPVRPVVKKPLPTDEPDSGHQNDIAIKEEHDEVEEHQAGPAIEASVAEGQNDLYGGYYEPYTLFRPAEKKNPTEDKETAKTKTKATKRTKGEQKAENNEPSLFEWMKHTVGELYETMNKEKV